MHSKLFPHVKYVMDKFKGKLPKDDLKRFAKEISKKLVSSDFKNNRVDDPTKIDSRKEKQVKSYVKEYFDKAASKHKEREQRRAERKVKQAIATHSSATVVAAEIKKEEEESDRDGNMAMSDEEDEKVKMESATPATPMDYVLTADGLKRKREDEDESKSENLQSTPSKILKSETPPPPPPPPPAPENGIYPSPSNLSNEVLGEEVETEHEMQNEEIMSPADALTNNVSAPAPPPPPASPPQVPPLAPLMAAES